MFTWVSIIYTIALFGLDDLSLKQIPIYSSNKDSERLFSFFLWVNKFGFLFSALITIVFVIIISILNGYGYLKYANYYLWGALSIPFFVLMVINQSILRGIGEIVKGQLSEKLFQPFVFLIFLIILYLSSSNLDDRLVIILRVLSFFLASLFTFYLIYKTFKGFKFYNFSNFVSKSWFKTCFIFMSSTLLFILNTRLDIIFLGFFKIRAEEIAYYNVALKFSDLSLIPFLVVCTVSTPIFSSLYYQNKKEELLNFYKKITRLSIVVMFFIILFFVLTGNWFLSWYGTNFESAYPILIILCLSKFVHVAIGPANYLLSMTGHEKAVVIALLLSVTISVILHVFLIPWYGILGASISTLVGLLFFDLFLLKEIYKHTGILIYKFYGK